MSDLGKIKPLYRPAAIKPLHKDSANKENRKDKKEDKDSGQEEALKEGNINEYI